MKKTIVQTKERWNFVGVYHPATKAKPAHMTDASCIRLWGTTGGLGELALKGPTKETKLDVCSVVVFPNPEAILFTIPCEWS